MLQGGGKQIWYSFIVFLGFSLLMLACKPESSSVSEEKGAYLADYESPQYHWGFIDTTGQIPIKAEYDAVSQFSENKAAFNKDGLWGYMLHSGKIIIKPQFRSAYNFHENRARVKPFDLPEYYITPAGQIISSKEWSASDDFSNNRAKVKVGTFYGYIDTSGSLIIKAVYSRAWNFDHGLAVVELQGKQGIIDVNGKYIIQPHFDHLKIESTCKMILALQDCNSMIINFYGNELDQLSQAIIKETDGQLTSVLKKDKLWLYSINEKKYLPGAGYEQLIYLGENLWSAKYGGGYHVLDDEGKEISDTIYSQINKFADGFAAYHRDNNWGYLDTTGKEVTQPIFGLAWDFNEGFARAAFKDGLAYINKNQAIAFYPPQGTVDLRDFHEGLSPIQMMQ